MDKLRDGAPVRITFVVASFNRRALTISALQSAFDAAKTASLSANAVLFDDGSSDGTAEAVRNEFGRDVRILTGDGSNYWAQSMAKAEATALVAEPPPGYLIWLNDDVRLDADALVRLVSVSRINAGAPLVASVRDPDSGITTYGGMRRAGRHPLSFEIITPTSSSISCDGMNGNVVMVPVDVAKRIGGIDGGFAHALADIDYAFRANQVGAVPLVAPGTYGTCRRNTTPDFDSKVEEWRYFVSIKGGGHPRSAARALRRMAPRSWLFWWMSTYILWWTRKVVSFTDVRSSRNRSHKHGVQS